MHLHKIKSLLCVLQALFLMETLSFDIINLIWMFSDTTKGFLSFLSTTAELDTFKPKIIFNKHYATYKKGYNKTIRYFPNIHFALTVKEPKTLYNIPENIKELTIDFVAHKRISHIPEGIISIKFLYATPIFEHFLPTTLRKLQLPRFFNAHLGKDILPFGLEHLKFGSRFNVPLYPGDIPETVTYLDLGWNYNCPLFPSSIPQSVKTLKFSKMFDQPLYPGEIPFGVEILKLGRNFNQIINMHVLPLMLKEIYFSEEFNQVLLPGTLPIGLTFIKFGKYYNAIIFEGVIPPTVKKIIFGDYYNQPLLKGSIPEGVEWIEFGENFSQKYKKVLPSTIQHVYVPREL